MGTMELGEVKDMPAGRFVPTARNHAVFVPNALPPPNLRLATLSAPLERATLALGELNGASGGEAGRAALTRAFARIEAIASCRLDGVLASLPDLLALEIAPESERVRPDTRAVANYAHALAYGIEQLRHAPFSKRLFCDIHRMLTERVGQEGGAAFPIARRRRLSSRIRSSLVRNLRPAGAPTAVAIDALGELEDFIARAGGELPGLVKAALVHYQLLAIGAFPPANGRIARLAVPLMLYERHMMATPLLYLSAYFERHHRDYGTLLAEVSRAGAWDAWIGFFLAGVEATARHAVAKARAIEALRVHYVGRVRAARTSPRLDVLLEGLFAVPAVTIPHAMRTCGLSYNAAKSNIRKLVDLKILTPDVGERRTQHFFAREIMHLSGPPAL